MQLAPSLHRVGSDMVNVYLIEDERGVTVIDAGLPGQWDEFTTELTEMGRSLEDVRGLILTHGDTDHLGFAERLREHGVPIYVHEADAPQATGAVKKVNPSWGRVKVRPLLSFLWYAGRRGGMRTSHVGEVTPVVDGALLDLPGNPRIIHTPGHSPGSIAIHASSVDTLFVGDAMTTRHVLTGARGPQPAPFTLDKKRALDSLRRWEDVKARWVLPGHGYPWDRGVELALTEIRARSELSRS
jgi:glyoxylase-like metal-dependent hydrolase (beta-lactamase superfamily II)